MHPHDHDDGGSAPGFILDMPDGLTTFRLPDGRTFGLDLIAAIRHLNTLREKHAASHWEYLDAVKAWLKQAASVELTDSQADWLSDRVFIEQQAVKKKRHDELESLRRTPD